MMVTIPVNVTTCDACNEEFAISHERCPHCGRPGLFPNVAKANTPLEREKLTSKRAASLASCEARKTQHIACAFEEACKTSKAVFTVGAHRLFRMLNTGTDLRETYYDLERLTNRTTAQNGKPWSVLRPQAEIELLGDHHNIHKIHYASLTLEGEALNYGGCKVLLRDEMISHRSSCFEGNTAVIYSEKHSFLEYARSNWGDRHELCVAMFGADIKIETLASEFPSILVQAGANSVDDRFIEVHIFGPMTCRTFEEVSFDTSKSEKLEASLVEGLKDKLISNSVRVK